MEFSRQEYWSGLLFPSPEDLPDPGIEPRSLALQVGFFFFYLLSHEGSSDVYVCGEVRGKSMEKESRKQ